MVLTITTTNANKDLNPEQILQEDPIAAVEAENANILHRGYEPLPQEPEVEESDYIESLDLIDQGYCPLNENDDQSDAFNYYIRNPESKHNSSGSSSDLSPQPIDNAKVAGPSCPKVQINEELELEESFSVMHLFEGAEPSDTRIQMNEKKVEEVKKIMLEISLPISYFPDWASELPEEEWKNFILRKLHLKRKENIIDVKEDSE